MLSLPAFLHPHRRPCKQWREWATDKPDSCVRIPSYKHSRNWCWRWCILSCWLSCRDSFSLEYMPEVAGSQSRDYVLRWRTRLWMFLHCAVGWWTGWTRPDKKTSGCWIYSISSVLWCLPSSRWNLRSSRKVFHHRNLWSCEFYNCFPCGGRRCV